MLFRSPPDAELRADLCGVEYGFNGKNEIQLEKKDDMKKRGLASPDLADALALTFAHPVTGGSWDLPQAQEFYKTDYDPFAKLDEDYWWGDS